jgi:6-phosphogluconolactonase
MKIDVFTDPDSMARQAAALIAAEARSAVAERGCFIFAVSGGHTPWTMPRALAEENIPWDKVHVFQVDERIASAGDPDRNLTHLRESLLKHAPLLPKQIHAMPVESADLDVAARKYAAALVDMVGLPPVLDLVHLGLGPDGHTASLLPRDPVLEITNTYVGVTGIYQGRRRMTLTYPTINRARRILWLVTGSERSGMLDRLLTADPSIPAGRVSQERAIVFSDRAAAKNGQPGRKNQEGVEQFVGQG